MKQILQNLRSGETIVAELPCPKVAPGQLLIRSRASLVSVGTERMLLDFGRANLIDKARQQPEKVKKVLDKVKTDGLFPTLDAVRTKLDQAMPLGYANAGIVIEVGEGVPDFKPGDRVVSNGPHAEVVRVPHRLCAKIPDGVTWEEAAFTVVGAIGLQGIRLLEPTLGERVVVVGLGLIGLLSVQILRAAGCSVLGVDLDPSRCAVAAGFGATTADLSRGEDPISKAAAFSAGEGVDAVLITASTKSSEPVSQAAAMCRKRGRIVLVGATGLELNRSDFYKKELSFQVSCSYGPGRYDPDYEIAGNDYPAAFVRWTEQRNFEAILDLMAQGSLDLEPLVSHRKPLDQATRIYEAIARRDPVLGAILEFPEQPGDDDPALRATTISLGGERGRPSGPGSVALIGAGNFASAVLAPALSKGGARLHTVASSGGVSGAHLGRKFGFEQTTTDTRSVFEDPAVDTVVISTRHDSHARLALEGLRAGKAVFVEKPLALSHEELESIETTLEEEAHPLLMVGFNRRFAPQVQKIAELLAPISQPKCFVMTVNAGAIPADSWVHDEAIGGGRILGEGCHFIDLLRFLAGSAIVSWQADCIGESPSVTIREDKATITLRFADGSLGTVHYLANGHKSFPKERLTVLAGERVLELDNFVDLRGWGWPGFKRMKLRRQDKGHEAEVAAFLKAVRSGGPAPIPHDQLIEVSRITLEVALALREERG
ncbi:MAG: bi-domain-containing oxidoreductase [Myxococcota bacterium]|nr:bi-domain-containing oxidoreductase [Myxococcota bacterium]